MASKQRGSKQRKQSKRVSSAGRHRALPTAHGSAPASKIVVGALATGALASSFWGFSSGTASAACMAIGGLGSIGDGSCSATGQGAWAISLFPGSTATADGAGNGALAIGLNNTASAVGGTNNISTALGIGNAATAIGGTGNRNTAIGLNNTASSIGLGAIGIPGVVVTDPTGNNNHNTAFGIGNSATSILGNGNHNIAGGVANTAATVGTPGVQLTALDTALGTITGTVDSTGNNNNNVALGFGNVALTALGNNNNNVAAGFLNQAATVGTPGADVTATLDALDLSGVIPGLNLTDITAHVQATPTGNGNNNFAIGAANTALTLFGNNNNNIAGGIFNQAATVGTPGIKAVVDATSSIPIVGDNSHRIDGNVERRSNGQ